MGNAIALQALALAASAVVPQSQVTALSATLDLLAGRTTEQPRFEPFEVWNSLATTAQDTSYVSLDLSNVVPADATAVRLVLGVYTGSTTAATQRAIQLAVRAAGDHFGGVAGDGGTFVTAILGPEYNQLPVEVRLSADQKVEIKRTNATGVAAWYRIQVVGYSGGHGAVFGGHQTLIASNQQNRYPSFPWSTLLTSGDVVDTWRDWDGTNPAAHSTGGAGWQSINEGAAVKICDVTTFGGTKQVQDVWTHENPSNRSQLVYVVRTYDGGGATNYYYATSTDGGATRSAFAAMPAITYSAGAGAGFNSGDYFFFDIRPSADGTKLYATVYGTRIGYSAGSSVAVAQSTDGVNWQVISWPLSAATGVTGDETGLINFPDGRWLAVIRNGANGSDGFTCYSDDGMLTWSTVTQRSDAKWQGPRGTSISASQCALYCRDFDSARYSGYACATWTLGRDGRPVGKSVHISNLANPSHGAYFAHPVLRNGKRRVRTYTDSGQTTPFATPGLVQIPFGWN